MKKFFILCFCLLAFESKANLQEVEVISAEYGVEDNENRKTLCLTIVIAPQLDHLLGIVEEIEDCFYARQARRSLDGKLMVNFEALSEVEFAPLQQHLQSMHPPLKFYFSEGE